MADEANYVYTYAFHEDEADLCGLEQRAWFGGGSMKTAAWIESGLRLDPSRSPFMKQRLHIRYEGQTAEDIASQAEEMELSGATFKVIFIPADGTEDYDRRRELERLVGARVRGRAEMRTPALRFGLAKLPDRWVFGEIEEQEAVWLRHKDKPRPYSTALSTRVARAIVNIAVPRPEGVRAVDPCCGIGTVLIEALSMGIDIAGFDKNPLAVMGARENLRHFGYPDLVRIRDIHAQEGSYDVAILDLPYNLCSGLSDDEQLALLQSARRLAPRIVVIAMEPIGGQADRAGLRIADGCVIRKGSFSRYVAVCESR